LVILTVLLVLAFPQLAEAANLPYLFDRLKKPAYRKPLETLLKTKGVEVPDWIRIFMKNYNGVASPGEAVEVDGRPFELYSVCQPHDCGGTFLYVLYPPGGERAWALITSDHNIVAFLGDSSPAQRKLLADEQDK
jgi:hypothetical protein